MYVLQKRLLHHTEMNHYLLSLAVKLISAFTSASKFLIGQVIILIQSHTPGLRPTHLSLVSLGYALFLVETLFILIIAVNIHNKMSLVCFPTTQYSETNVLGGARIQTIKTFNQSLKSKSFTFYKFVCHNIREGNFFCYNRCNILSIYKKSNCLAVIIQIISTICNTSNKNGFTSKCLVY